MTAISVLALVIGAIIAYIVIIILFYISRYKRVPPDSAMVIYGKGASDNKDGMIIITGGGKFGLPMVQSFERTCLFNNLLKRKIP